MKKIITLSVLCAFAASVAAPVATAASAYTSTEEYITRLQLSPSVVARIESKSDYDEMLASADKPGSVILGVGQDCLTAEDETSVGSVEQTFASLDESGILPVCRVESHLQAQSLATAAEQIGNYDFALTGDDVGVLQKAKEFMPEARVYLDLSAEERYEDAYDYLLDARSAGGNVVILSERQADEDTVYYLQSMMTTVWVKTQAESKFDFASAISTGAYGIVTKDYKTLYRTYDEYPVYSLPRGYYVVGHRGLPYDKNENSIEGCLAAYEAGATHLEIDVHMTADDKLIVMHDDTIDRTTNGTGAVRSMTLEEIRRFQITKTMDGKETGERSEIPTLAEVFEAFAEKDAVIIVEIKDSNPAICALVKEEIERCGMEKKTLCISFHDGAGGPLERMHEIMPSLPIASLLQITEANFEQYIKRAALWNMVFDPPLQTGHATFINSNLKDRGYMACLWTYNEPSPVQLGITCHTNNHADIFENYAKRLTVTEELHLQPGEEIAQKTFPVTKMTFGGKRETVQAKVFMSEKTEGGYRAILCYEDKDDDYYCKVNVFTRPVFISEITESGGDAPEKNHDNTAIIVGISVGAAVLAGGAAAVVAVIIIRKKRGVR